MTLIFASASTAGSIATSNYAAYLGGPLHVSYAKSSTTFTTANVGGAHSIWTWTPVAVPGTKSTIDASATTYAGVVYIGAETGDFYAINAGTGVRKWRKRIPIDNCGNRGIISSATVARDPVTNVLTVYVAGNDQYLYALKASTGATVWRAPIGGDDTLFVNWSSPTVAGGHVYMGVASGCADQPGPDGLIAVDQHTGAQTGRYYIGGNPTTTGASVYTSAAVAADGSVFITTGDDNGGSTTDATSIVKLAAGTLTRLDGYQIPGVTGLNLDFNASPTLFDAGSTPMVGACDKNGIFYALKQSDLSAPVWTRKLGIPPAPNSLAFCGGSAVFDGKYLYVGADAKTKTSAPGSMYRLNPTTGRVSWYTPLPNGPVIGSPSLDGAGILAVPTYNKAGTGAVYLISKSTGTILKTISYASPIFSQPVFADSELLVGGPNLQAYTP